MIRISKIGGRYLIFDVQDVGHLRRHHNLCSVLVGITPQAPNQNLFSGLPLEVTSEEVKMLVERRAALVEDDCAAHLSQLSSADASSRRHYVESLRKQRRGLQALLEKQAAEKQRQSAEARAKFAGKSGKRRKPSEPTEPVQKPSAGSAEESLFDSPAESSKAPRPARPVPVSFAFTPTTTLGLFRPGENPATVEAQPSAPLQAHLNSRGFYTTPGIRFGGDYSVYPGDPFRYHAHYMATSYGWDEEMDLLDLVSGGRLATGVKKGFVIGGEKPRGEGEGEGNSSDSSVRAFTLEWAAM